MGADEARAGKLGRPKTPGLEARRQAEILAAAATTFATFGYTATDVQQIADTLGVGKGTIYRYFPTKQKLFLAALERGLQELTDEIDAHLADVTADPIDLIRRAIYTYLAFFHRRPEMVELFIQERAAFRDQHLPLYFGPGHCNRPREVAFIEALMVAGRLAPGDPEAVLDVLGDLAYGTVVSNHLSGRPNEPHKQADDIIRVVFFGVLSETERQNHTKQKERI